MRTAGHADTEDDGTPTNRAFISLLNKSRDYTFVHPSVTRLLDEVPSAILHAADGRLWMLGATDGYSNGRDDTYLLVAPSPGVGNNETYFNEEVSIIENAVSVGAPFDPSPVSVFPNPVRNEFTLSGVGNATKWTLVDASGRTVVSGQGPRGDASDLPGGTYWLVLEAAPSPAVLTLQIAQR